MPPGVVTLIAPLAPSPTSAAISASELTVKKAAGVLPNLTAVAPVKLVPVMVITAPVPLLLGVNEVIVGL